MEKEAATSGPSFKGVAKPMNQDMQFLLTVGGFGLLILFLLLLAAKGFTNRHYNAQMDAHQRQEATSRTARSNEHGD